MSSPPSLPQVSNMSAYENSNEFTTSFTELGTNTAMVVDRIRVRNLGKRVVLVYVMGINTVLSPWIEDENKRTIFCIGEGSVLVRDKRIPRNDNMVTILNLAYLPTTTMTSSKGTARCRRLTPRRLSYCLPRLWHWHQPRLCCLGKFRLSLLMRTWTKTPTITWTVSEIQPWLWTGTELGILVKESFCFWSRGPTLFRPVVRGREQENHPLHWRKIGLGSGQKDHSERGHGGHSWLDPTTRAWQWKRLQRKCKRQGCSGQRPGETEVS